MTCSTQLRPYQLDVLERGRARLRAGCRRLLIQAATGAGKTHVSSELCRAAVAKGRRALFVAHRRRLIDQKCQRLRAFGVRHGVVMAASGPDLPYDPDAPVQVASRDTLLARCVRPGVRGLSLPPADVVIVDEAHNLLADQYLELVAAYANSVVVGLTATPARADGKGMGDYFDALECAVPTSQLVREGWLVPVRCYAPDRRDARRGGVVGDPVAHWRRHADGRPTVLFAPKVAASLAAVAAFNAAGIPAEHIDAQTPDADRDAAVERVRSGRTMVVSNVNIWTEGVDVPELSCCVLLRRCTSYVLFAQAVGRVMRPSPGKADAVLIDHAGAVLRHGFPDDDVEWTLDVTDSVDRRNRERRERGDAPEPVLCPGCGLLYRPAAACPACGHVIRRRRPKAERGAAADGLLVEVGRAATEAARREEMVRHWHTCLRVMAYKGRTAAAASQMYRSRYGVWPDASLPNVPAAHQRGLRVAELYPQYLGRRGG